MTATRVEHDSIGPVNVHADKLWGAQTQRSLEHFRIGEDLILREMIPANAIVKKAASLVNFEAGRLGAAQANLIVRVCDEILAGVVIHGPSAVRAGAGQGFALVVWSVFGSSALMLAR